MCGKFVMLTYDEVADVIRSIQIDTPYIIDPDWPARKPSAYPGSIVPIITADHGLLTPQDLRWGFEVDWQKNLVFNTRIESALSLKSSMWKKPIAEGRCIVATAGFFEPHASETIRIPCTGKEIKRQYLFQAPGDHPTFLAAVKNKDAFSIVTTQPNQWISSIHKRMPIVLEVSEIKQWIEGDYEVLADRSQTELVVYPADELSPAEGPVQQSLL